MKLVLIIYNPKFVNELDVKKIVVTSNSLGSKENIKFESIQHKDDNDRPLYVVTSEDSNQKVNY